MDKNRQILIGGITGFVIFIIVIFGLVFKSEDKLTPVNSNVVTKKASLNKDKQIKVDVITTNETNNTDSKVDGSKIEDTNEVDLDSLIIEDEKSDDSKVDGIEGEEVSITKDIEYIDLDNILDTKSDKELIRILERISNEK